MLGRMGPPLNSQSSRDNDAGPSNGHGNVASGSKTTSVIRNVQKVNPAGRLMYEDDKDWADSMELKDRETAIAGQAGDSVFEAVSRRKHQPGDKRMPVNREEVVRLILQGLKDIGYK